MLAEMSKNLEGVHGGFLIQVTGKTCNQQIDGTWRNAALVSVLKETGTQTLGTYIGKRQATVAEWMELRPILEVYNREPG